MTANTFYATQPYPTAAAARALLLMRFRVPHARRGVLMDENVHGSAYVVFSVSLDGNNNFVFLTAVWHTEFDVILSMMSLSIFAELGRSKLKIRA